MYRLFLLLLVLLPIELFTQNSDLVKKVDSLLMINDITTSERINQLENFIKDNEEDRISMAYGLHKLGILYYRAGTIDKAIFSTKKSIEIRKETSPINFYLYLNSLYNLSSYYKILGKEKDQKNIIREILAYPKKNKFTYKSEIELAYIIGERGDYFRALKNFKEVISNFNNYSDLYTYFKAHEGIIWCYSKIDEPKRYIKDIEYYLKIIGEISEKHKIIPDEAFNNNLANIFEGIGKDIDAINLYKKSEVSYQQNKDSSNLAKIFNNLGRLYNKLGEFNKAENYFNESLKLSTDLISKAAVYNNRGEYLNPEKRIFYNKKAIEVLIAKVYDYLPSYEDLLSSKYKVKILTYLMENVDSGLELYKNNNNPEQLELLKSTALLIDKLISSLRQESIEDMSKLYWIRKAASFYMNAVALAYYDNNVKDGLYYMEKNKGLLLLENLHKKQGETNEELKLEKIQESIVNYANGDKCFVEYILNEKDGFGIFYNAQEKIFFRLDSVPQLIENVNKLRAKMANYFINKQDKKEYSDVGRKVFKSLFPFDNAIEKITNKELTIVPDNVLQYINFEALTPTISNSYLVEHTTINYLLSISLSNKLNKFKSNEDHKVLGFAPVSFTHDSLPNLQRSVATMHQIADTYPSVLFLKDKASKENFLKELKNHTIVHLNTHAGMDPIENQPWIAFNDKNLSLEELKEVQNNCDLVVLDACNGAIGEQEIGEGVMSLSRGFFIGGAKSVITTQWKANEKAINEILTNFYTQIKKGKSKSESLRLAKLDYLNAHQLSERSPYYWGSLILTGNTNAIVPEFNFFRLIWGVLVMVLVFISSKLIINHFQQKKE